MEMKVELAEVPVCITTKEVIGKPTIGVEIRLLLVSDLLEVPEGVAAEDDVRKRLFTRTKQTRTS